MKAKILAGMTVVLMALSAPLFADSSHHQGGTSEGTMQSSGMGMMDMEKMHEHMANMQEIMKKIHDTKDKAKQKELMQQHMSEMRKGMSTMMAGKHGGMSAMKGKHNDMTNGGMMKSCHDMTAQRMEMMQGMMGQMMEHMQQQSMTMGN